MAKELTEREYWKEIKDFASMLIEEAAEERGEERSPDLLDAVMEKVPQAVSDHEWIIYYAYAYDVIRFSANEEAWEESGGPEMLREKKRISFREILVDVAFYAMMRDVEEEISDQLR